MGTSSTKYPFSFFPMPVVARSKILEETVANVGTVGSEFSFFPMPVVARSKILEEAVASVGTVGSEGLVVVVAIIVVTEA